jgi:hypothetical protein
LLSQQTLIGMSAALSSKLTPRQLYMLQVFDRNLTEEQEAEVKQLLADFFFKLAEEEADRLVAERGYDQSEFDAMLTSRRTAYRPKTL